jgi:hypothetical protein
MYDMGEKNMICIPFSKYHPTSGIKTHCKRCPPITLRQLEHVSTWLSKLKVHMPSNLCSMFCLPTDFVIFSTKKLGIFLGVACVNLNNLAKNFFWQKFTKNWINKHGVGVDINHSLENITSSQL